MENLEKFKKVSYKEYAYEYIKRKILSFEFPLDPK